MRRSEGDDVGLWLAAASGDDRAFGEFYRRWLPLVTGYHLRRSRSRELAFDLTAETFAAVVADLQRFDPDRGSPAGWLFEIAEHKLLDSVRGARVDPLEVAVLQCQRLVAQPRTSRALDPGSAHTVEQPRDRPRSLRQLGDLARRRCRDPSRPRRPPLGSCGAPSETFSDRRSARELRDIRR